MKDEKFIKKRKTNITVNLIIEGDFFLPIT